MAFQKVSLDALALAAGNVAALNTLGLMVVDFRPVSASTADVHVGGTVVPRPW